ncbi:MAG: AbrB/MazE/SpoVT family DNA-binding domain-containing protein [Allosphingosinicella sp.]
MIYKLKIEKIGSAAGLVLPQEALDHLGARVGQTLIATKTAGGVELVLAPTEFEAQMRVAREVMRRHRQALGELAKD